MPEQHVHSSVQEACSSCWLPILQSTECAVRILRDDVQSYCLSFLHQACAERQGTYLVDRWNSWSTSHRLRLGSRLFEDRLIINRSHCHARGGSWGFAAADVQNAAQGRCYSSLGSGRLCRLRRLGCCCARLVCRSLLCYSWPLCSRHDMSVRPLQLHRMVLQHGQGR